LSELQKNTALSPFLNKKGSFVIGEDVGTALLVGAAFKKKNENYVIVTNNLYTAQKIYTFILNFLKEEECLLFPHDDSNSKLKRYCCNGNQSKSPFNNKHCN
jgi:hypothetical protein